MHTKRKWNDTHGTEKARADVAWAYIMQHEAVWFIKIPTTQYLASSVWRAAGLIGYEVAIAVIVRGAHLGTAVRCTCACR